MGVEKRRIVDTKCCPLRTLISFVILNVDGCGSAADVSVGSLCRQARNPPMGSILVKTETSIPRDGADGFDWADDRCTFIEVSICAECGHIFGCNCRVGFVGGTERLKCWLAKIDIAGGV